jgi:hypothetical protein
MTFSTFNLFNIINSSNFIGYVLDISLKTSQEYNKEFAGLGFVAAGLRGQVAFVQTSALYNEQAPPSFKMNIQINST